MTSRQRQRQVGDVAAVVLAVAAFASSLRHVQTVAATHGQVGWLSWSIAVGTELVALASILEIRRGKDDNYRPVAGWVGLVFGLLMSGGANLATAHGRGWFWSHAMALAPVVEYLIVVVMVETRPGRSLARKRRQIIPAAPPAAMPEPGPPARKTPAEPVPASRLSVVPTPARSSIDPVVLAAVRAGNMTQVAAAEKAGVSVRTLQRQLKAGNSHAKYASEIRAAEAP